MNDLRYYNEETQKYRKYTYIQNYISTKYQSIQRSQFYKSTSIIIWNIIKYNIIIDNYNDNNNDNNDNNNDNNYTCIHNEIRW